MPTYAYTCSECGHEMEASQKISEAPLTTCPECQKEGLKRGIGGGSATFRFIGDGFYINDYNDKKGGCSSPDCGSGCKSS